MDILDINALDLSFDESLMKIKEHNPDIIGFTSTTPTINRIFKMAEEIKQKYPEKVIVLGGPHPSAIPEESIQKRYVDFVVIGEGEETFLELVREMDKKEGKNFRKIKGLVFKEKGKVVINDLRDKIADLDSLPFPALELLPLKKYLSANSKLKSFVSILTSRGCPGVCTYCNKKIFGNKCFMRSAENIIKEIEHWIRIYGYRDFHILDDLFTNDRQRVVDFCNLILKKKLNILWKCGNGVRVGTVDLELLKLMKKAGCYSLSYGIESGNQKILNLMKKGQTLKQCRNAVLWTKEAGIECIGFFMFGNIGENEKTMQETIDFAKSLLLDIAQFSILVPYPGTPIREQIEKEGEIFEKDWEEYDNLNGKCFFKHGELTPLIVEKMNKKAYKEFYFRPKYILKKLFKRRTIHELKGELNGFLTLLGY